MLYGQWCRVGECVEPGRVPHGRLGQLRHQGKVPVRREQRLTVPSRLHPIRAHGHRKSGNSGVIRSLGQQGIPLMPPAEIDRPVGIVDEHDLREAAQHADREPRTPAERLWRRILNPTPLFHLVALYFRMAAYRMAGAGSAGESR